MLVFFVLISLALSSSCMPNEEDRQNPRTPIASRITTVSWEVLEVRITALTEKRAEDKSGDAVAGALLGAVVLGPVGAVAGAGIGASGSAEVVAISTPIACLMKVRQEDGEIRVMTFRKTYDEKFLLDMCTLARPGDTLEVTKYSRSGKRIWRGRFLDISIRASQEAIEE